MSRKFGHLFKKFCTETSILGLKYFYLYPDRMSRCYWSINLLAVLGTACALTVLLWNRFKEMPTRITIENEYSPIQKIPYPAVTICTPNQMTVPNVHHFQRTLVDGDVKFDFLKQLPQLLGFYEQVASIDAGVLHQLQRLIDLNRHNVRDVMSSLAQGCDQFLKHCLYAMKVVDCRELFNPILTGHGLCCIFNSPHRKSNRHLEEKFSPKLPAFSGPLQGLTVVTDYSPQDALNGTLLYAGATKIMFNDWTEFPSNDESTLVYPHVEAFHSIRGVSTYCSDEVIALPVMSRRCVFPDEYQLNYFEEYHNSDCDLECFLKEVWKRCNCVMYYVPMSRPSQRCTIDSISCIIETRANLTDPKNGMEHCECPRDCLSRTYKVDMSLGTNLRAHEHLIFHHLYENVTLTRSSTVLHIYFANPFYTLQKQETVMSLINLTSNLGGVFGMCLGCSVISVLEVLFFLYKAVLNARKRALSYRRRRLVQAVQQCKQ